MKRGFKAVSELEMEHGEFVKIHGRTQLFFPEVKLPVRADNQSAGYDFYAPTDVTIPPRGQVTVWTNVKAYMQPDEVLMMYIRSSMGIVRGLTLANGTGVIDASYGKNIAIALVNTKGTAVEIKAGERIAQGVFLKYLVADEDEVLSESRTGGIGSSGK